jgi:ribosomal protein S18 acetylase RimI-like enzyme
MEIRLATLEDAPLLAALNGYVQALHHEAYPELFKPPAANDEIIAYFGEQLEEPENDFFLAEIEAEPAGYLWARFVHQPPNPFMHAIDHFVVEHIAVVPRWRRRGVGHALLDAAREGALERDLHLLTLSVWAFNARAQSVFARAGYEPYTIRMWREAAGKPPAAGPKPPDDG